MARRSFLAIGTAHYRNPEDELPSVPAAVRSVAQTFRGLGYAVDGEVLDPTCAEAKEHIDRWLNAEPWGPDDHAVLYWTGHGDSAGAGHYLLTSDSEHGRYATTAVRSEFLVEVLGDEPTIRHLLVILDTCYSEAGGTGVQQLAQRMETAWPASASTPGRQYWLVSSARAKEEARQQVFADTFARAVSDSRDTFGVWQRHITLQAVTGEINLLFSRAAPPVRQRATVRPLFGVEGEDSFIDNPHFVAPRELPDIAGIARPEDLASHWMPRARGGVAGTRGRSFFSGRSAVLDALQAWAAAPEGERVAVVTGDPGSGKTTVLAHLVVGSADGDEPGADEEAGIEVSRAVVARGKTANEMREEVADLLGVAGAADRALVVIDGLDEAVDPPEAVSTVVGALAAAGARVLVGARRATASLVRGRVVDLDAHGFWVAEDLVAYVEALLRSGGGVAPSPYAGDDASVRTVARAVAAAAGRSFLVAGILAGHVCRRGHPLRPDEVADVRQAGSAFADAFEQDLGRLGGEAETVRQLLAGLAWARGAGLPWEGIWPAVASAVGGGVALSDDDVRRTLELAGDLVVETTEHGRSVYRLYHELFAEHLRARSDPRATERAICFALVAATPTTLDGLADWAGAHPYVRHHLAEHAARAGELESLAGDARYLMAADPERLAVALAQSTEVVAGPATRAMERSLEHLGREDAASQLCLAAMQTGARALEESAAALAAEHWWRPLWADWVAEPSRTTLHRFRGEVVGIGATTVDGLTLVVAASSDGDLVCVDVATRRVLWQQTLEVRLERAVVAGRLVAVAGKRAARVVDVVTGATVGPPLRGSREITALALHVDESGERWQVAAGTCDFSGDALPPHGWIASWSGATSRPQWERVAFGGVVLSLHFTDRGRMIVAAGDSYGDEQHVYLRSVRADDGASIQEIRGDTTVAAYAGVLEGGAAVLASTSSDPGQLLRWGGDARSPVRRASSGRDLWSPGWIVAEPGGERVLIVQSRSVAVVDAMSMVETATVALPFTVRALAAVRHGGHVYVIANTSASGEVAAWRLSELVAAPSLGRGEVVSADIGADVVVAAYERPSDVDPCIDVTTRRARDAAPVSTVRIREQITAVGLVGGAPERVLLGSGRGMLSLRTASDLDAVVWSTELHQGPVDAVAVHAHAVVSAGRDARVHFVDLDSGSRLCRPVGIGVYHDRPVQQLALSHGQVVALYVNGWLVAWSYTDILKDEPGAVREFNAARHRVLLRYHHMSGMAATDDGGELVVYVPDTDGSVSRVVPGGPTRAWNAHDLPVTALASYGDHGLLTGDGAGLVRFWDVDTECSEPVGEIELGRPVRSLRTDGGGAVLVVMDHGVAVLALATRRRNSRHALA